MSPAELVERLVGVVGDILGSSSLRFGVLTTLAVLGVVLVLLQLVARPVTRWMAADAGGLEALGRAMAVAAESGTDVVVAIGNGGITRATDAGARLQTLASLPVLAHVARAAARAGVPLRVLTNDPLAGVMASATLDAGHRATDTLERASRSRAVFVGEGRTAPAGMVLTARARPAVAVAVGSFREEAALQLEGLRGGAGSLTAGTAEPSQAGNVLVGGGTLIGPGPYQLAADLRSDAVERTVVMAGNRLIGLAVLAVVLGGIAGLAGLLDPLAVRSLVGAE